MYTKWLNEIGIGDINLVGGKNASLGEMIQHLSSVGINVPFGFAVTTQAYLEFLNHNNLEAQIQSLVKNIEEDPDNLINLRRNGLEIRSLIQNGNFPSEMEEEILDNYLKLSLMYKDHNGEPQRNTDVAVRSSSTAEDLPEASFAGQQETYLNVRGKFQLLESIKNCFASLYTDRAISYRLQIGYHQRITISVCVQKMVRSDLGSAGVAFSIDTETGFRDTIVINGSWGLGEMVVQGSIKPDEIIIFKKKLEEGYQAIIDKKLGHKTHKLVYGTNPDQKVKEIPVSENKYAKFCITDQQTLQLGQWVIQIEKYYSNLYNKWTPVDTEWAIDGLSKELYIVQARPETIHANRESSKVIEYQMDKKESYDLENTEGLNGEDLNKKGKKKEIKPILEGIAVGDSISTGRVRIIHSLDNRDSAIEEIFNDGDVLVTDITDPDWEPLMKRAGAIITNRGGRACHGSIVARELGITAVVGTENGTEVLKNGQLITISCAEGDIGYIYDGNIPYKKTETDLSKLPEIKTTLMFNMASPNDVFKYSFYPAKGVGLVREEFIINNFIKVHPLALLNYEKHRDSSNSLLYDPALVESIDKLILGFKSPIDYYIEKLSFGISRIATAFYPHDVIVRFSDFKSNEYRNLLGGNHYEPMEENPMIGWRGASRYYSEKFKEAFGLECLAIKRIREEIGLDNVIVMIPFCRTPEECKKVIETMKEFGLERGKNGLKVFIMCEIPSNVILAKEFCQLVDGFSIGSNDLTQLTLGLDRDSSLVAHIYNERHPSVKKMLSKVIKVCKKEGVKIGICGQGPSDYPDFAQFLVSEGIDSISITPDALLKTLNAIHAIENNNKVIC